MTKDQSIINHVRAFFVTHGRRRREGQLQSTTRRAQVASYVIMLQQTAAGVEAHALTLRRSRDEATVALIHLQTEAENARDRPGERYVVAARAYVEGLESFIAGEGAGKEQLEQLRLDYDQIKDFVK